VYEIYVKNIVDDSIRLPSLMVSI